MHHHNHQPPYMPPQGQYGYPQQAPPPPQYGYPTPPMNQYGTPPPQPQFGYPPPQQPAGYQPYGSPQPGYAPVPAPAPAMPGSIALFPQYIAQRPTTLTMDPARGRVEADGNPICLIEKHDWSNKKELKTLQGQTIMTIKFGMGNYKLERPSGGQIAQIKRHSYTAKEHVTLKNAVAPYEDLKLTMKPHGISQKKWTVQKGDEGGELMSLQSKGDYVVSVSPGMDLMLATAVAIAVFMTKEESKAMVDAMGQMGGGA